MRLTEGPAARRGEVAAAAGAQHAADLAEVQQLVGRLADVLDHVVRDDDVEARVGERERGAVDAAELEAVGDDPLVAQVDGDDVAVRPGELCQRGGDVAGAAADVEDLPPAERVGPAEQAHELLGLRLPRGLVEGRVAAALGLGQRVAATAAVGCVVEVAWA